MNIKKFLQLNETSDKQHEKLKKDIEKTMEKLRSLQAKFKQQTGKEYRPF